MILRIGLRSGITSECTDRVELVNTIQGASGLGGHRGKGKRNLWDSGPIADVKVHTRNKKLVRETWKVSQEMKRKNTKWRFSHFRVVP